MDIRELTYITAIAEEGSLSAAGKRLKVSQPTLSVFLSKLENSLGPRSDLPGNSSPDP